MTSRPRMSLAAGSKVPRSSGVYRSRGSLGPSVPPSLPRAGRPSLSRQSNIHTRGPAQVRQDPRPVNDKIFQKECMLKLIEFLTSHGFTGAISSKLPSGKEIRDIIEFIFRQVDPNVVLVKLEDDVPVFFKNLGYPFQISKSALYAAGSPHSWPGLLAALTWLVDLLVYDEKAKEIREAGNTELDNDNGETLFFEYISAAYSEFLCGNDEACAKLDADVRVQFEEDNAQLARHVTELEASVSTLAAKLQALTGEPSPLSVLEAKKADFVNDIAKFTNIINNFQSHKEASMKKIEERKQNLDAVKADIDKASKENDELRQRIGAQEISVAGVEKMDKESQILDTNLRAVSNLAQEVEKEAWENEVQTSKILRELEVVAANYNTASARLKDMDAEIDPEHNVEYEFKVNPREDKPEDILGRDIKGVIKPALAGLLEGTERSMRDNREAILQVQKQLYADEAAHQERLDEIAALKAQCKKVEAQYKSRKEKLDAYIASKAAERAELDNKLESDRRSIAQSNKEAGERLKRVEAELVETERLSIYEMEREQAEILEQMQAFMEHKEHIQKVMARLAARADQTLDMAKNNSLVPRIEL